ncbi:hypothetical protein [Draconibacterium halophilum]|uniref:Uncharacterized protein n=1 Tax=Draconibacterium halophilum TaxID=2706887 RepID=A0A6C0RJH5_9BACT|nr:hypothetical protein [Draconibacterium halophilum]QIA09321.1 hypothetical protein G0Q07_17110 [Draconibacterium halophilum]
MSDNLTESMAGLNEAVKQYVQTRIDLVKLLFLKKTSKYMSILFGMLIIILLSTLILAFAGVMFTFWYGQTYDNYLEGASIVLGSLIFILIVFILFRKKLLTTFFLSNFSEILFEDDEIDHK